jgi:hypothetical protein
LAAEILALIARRVTRMSRADLQLVCIVTLATEAELAAKQPADVNDRPTLPGAPATPTESGSSVTREAVIALISRRVVEAFEVRLWCRGATRLFPPP